MIGAGAAGFMAAIFAAGAPAPAPVLLLERTREGGRKILMSGGGRCNVLPSDLDPARFVTASSPHTMRNLLLSWPLHEQRRFFEEDLGIPLVLEAETGKLFPASNRSRDVRDALRAMAERRGVDTRFDACVEGLEPPMGADGPNPAWAIRLSNGNVIRAARVILATGGLSVPATGSDGIGLRIARELGHTIHDTYPALTPLTAEPHHFAPLAGISLPVSIEAPGPPRSLTTRGGFLFTHKGYSGPAVLNVSHRAVLSRGGSGPRQELLVRWVDRDADDCNRWLREGEGTVLGLLRRQLPTRLAETLVNEAGVPASMPLAHLERAHRRVLVEILVRYRLPWSSDEGYKRAEVTGGGVALGEIDPRTLESRIRPGLHLCGEILDAFGPIGGYNFVWAWATGRAAGQGAAGLVPARTAVAG